jgi:hypothetical protein
MDSQRAWSQLPIKVDPQVYAFFCASTFTIVGDGRKALFWEDRWIDGEAPRDIAPNLFLMVPARTRAQMSVLQGLTDRNNVRPPRAHRQELDAQLLGGLNTTTAVEYLDLWNATAQFQFHDRPDQTVCPMGLIPPSPPTP